jgi:hypothetical protein
VLNGAGIKFVVVDKSISEHLTSLKNVRPGGYPPGSTYENALVGGGFDANSKTVIIATNGRSGSFSNVLHETGHALDYIFGYPSRKSAFTTRYGLDSGALSAYQQQSGNAGFSEAYAESFARFYGGDATLSSSAPNIYGYFNFVSSFLGAGP